MTENAAWVAPVLRLAARDLERLADALDSNAPTHWFFDRPDPVRERLGRPGGPRVTGLHPGDGAARLRRRLGRRDGAAEGRLARGAGDPLRSGRRSDRAGGPRRGAPVGALSTADRIQAKAAGSVHTQPSRLRHAPTAGSPPMPTPAPTDTTGRFRAAGGGVGLRRLPRPGTRRCHLAGFVAKQYCLLRMRNNLDQKVRRSRSQATIRQCRNLLRPPVQRSKRTAGCISSRTRAEICSSGTILR